MNGEQRVVVDYLAEIVARYGAHNSLGTRVVLIGIAS